MSHCSLNSSHIPQSLLQCMKCIRCSINICCVTLQLTVKKASICFLHVKMIRLFNTCHCTPTIRQHIEASNPLHPAFPGTDGLVGSEAYRWNNFLYSSVRAEGPGSGEQLALRVGIREGFKKEEIFEIGLEVCIEAYQMKMVEMLAKR